mmetsp:Transcript_26871/g.62837  ORF Transcript_26871/g.62837 Transcript_26871/m.62837 type:complete len:241 (+) Transcript_26871:1124-1846(+)
MLFKREPIRNGKGGLLSLSSLPPRTRSPSRSSIAVSPCAILRPTKARLGFGFPMRCNDEPKLGSSAPPPPLGTSEDAAETDDERSSLEEAKHSSIARRSGVDGTAPWTRTEHEPEALAKRIASATSRPSMVCATAKAARKQSPAPVSSSTGLEHGTARARIASPLASNSRDPDEPRVTSTVPAPWSCNAAAQCVASNVVSVFEDDADATSRLASLSLGTMKSQSASICSEIGRSSPPASW